ncbi:MAG TPA: hypothetical protein VMQ93_13470 [Novosphingobium sp.]|nr:hypothetical protein [Novosphingobium sp.]
MIAWILGGAAGGLLGYLVFGGTLPTAVCACLGGIVTAAVAQPRSARAAQRGDGSNSSGDGGGDGGWDSHAASDCSDGGSDGGGGDGGGGCD